MDDNAASDMAVQRHEPTTTGRDAARHCHNFTTTYPVITGNNVAGHGAPVSPRDTVDSNLKQQGMRLNSGTTRNDQVDINTARQDLTQQ